MMKSTFIWMSLFLFFQSSLRGQEVKPMPYNFSSQVEKAFKYTSQQAAFPDFEGPYLVKAYKQSEGILATPLDIIEVNDPKQDSRTLVLPSGMYLFEIRNIKGEQKFFTDTIKP